MQKVLGTHRVKTKNGGSVQTAVLDCGHEVAYDAVRWMAPAEGGTPEGHAECKEAHDGDGKRDDRRVERTT